ncbi:ubiquitin-like domain-containing protein [Chitinophaga nivalis]|uniref:Ubiquitin family protein n=1 Tax=Chitinophaga nivalis TaxID=2991709 RepID=A0ABT3IH27_9BACT|nr:ubiquitin-like domain-containing protein [Chitinophaga nivalis]MCW3467066.1 ubiquitin family protein [Chitinophaga nivalis]MCW3483243.1 ubiquitin family protein [Chitinophaga nivalis]
MKKSTMMLSALFCALFAVGVTIGTNASDQASTNLLQEPAGKFEVAVGYHENKAIHFVKVEVNGDNTAGELKEKVIAQTSIPCRKGSIVYKKKRLKDDEKLQQADVHAGDSLFLACLK